MRRKSPMLDASRLKKGPWTPEEDQKLIDYINKHGHGSWRALPKHAGLNRRGPSCRIRWINYLRPDIKRGNITDEEEQTIVNLHSFHGNKLSLIAQHLPGRTDNEIKNFWNSTRLKKKLLSKGIDPVTHRPRTDPECSRTCHVCLQSDGTQLAKLQLLNSILQILNSSSTVIPSNMEAVNNFLSLNLRKISEAFKTNSQIQDCFNPEDVNHYNQFPNLESQQQQFSADYHPMNDSKNCADNSELARSYSMTSSGVLEDLVSGSPERNLENLFGSYKSNCVSNLSSSSTNLEEWGNLKDSELSDFWRQILEYVGYC